MNNSHNEKTSQSCKVYLDGLVAQNAKSCSKLAEHNIFMPNDNLL